MPLAELADGVAQGPDALRVGDRLSKRRAGDQARLERALEPRPEASVIGDLVRALGLGQNVAGVFGPDRRAGAKGVLQAVKE
jgi:hypothetical protein